MNHCYNGPLFVLAEAMLAEVSEVCEARKHDVRRAARLAHVLPPAPAEAPAHRHAPRRDHDAVEHPERAPERELRVDAFYLLLASASEAIFRYFSACTLSSRAEAALRSGDVSHFAHL